MSARSPADHTARPSRRRAAAPRRGDAGTATLHELSFDEWLTGTGRQSMPPQAVVLLDIVDAQRTVATVVDAGNHVIVARVRMLDHELAKFSAAFLRTCAEGETRSILLAPTWLNEQHEPTAAPTPKPKADRLSGGVAPIPPGRDGASLAGVSPIGEKPPEPPKFQAMVRLAARAAALQHGSRGLEPV
jgi:hypothetical protein